VTSVKTAVSLPGELYDALRVVAEASGKSRSSVLAEALRQYIRRLEADETRQQHDEFADSLTEEEVEEQRRFLAVAARRHAETLNRLGYVWED
jgi:metal-responsive CopG/Arc/MetJ family transcriptional regulator